ncbi:MAG: DNA translocase FtsK 4TM domain-containing protein [Acidimicrobiia bacterium]
MATRTAAKRRAPAKRAKKPRARRPAPPPEPTLRIRAREAARRELGGHGADAAAVGLLVLAILTTLGLTSDLAGPVGQGLADGFATLVGKARYAVPVVGIGFAILLFRVGPSARRAAEVDPADDDEEARAEPAPVRVGTGIALLGLAAVGALHLLGDSPALDGKLERLQDAGGYLGGAIAGPLQAGTGTVGTSVVLAGLAVLGALLAPGVPMRDVIASLGRGTRWLGHQARAYSDLPPRDEALLPDDDGHGLDEIDLTGAGAPESAELYDVELDALPAVTLDDDPTLTDLPPPAIAEELDGQLAIDVGGRQRGGSWKLPPLSVLKKGDAKQTDRKLVDEAGKALQAALHQHGVDAKLVGATVGPTVTRFELELAPGVKVNRVTGLAHDLAYAMASADVRILAPIPGRSAVGVEVPNRQRQLVTLGDILVSPEAKAATQPLEVGLGRDISGRSVMLNLAELPHVLIAGATGAGKSSCINSLVTSLLMRNTPDQVRLILVDPKRVELGAYNDLPHLLTAVVTNPKRAANALDWAVREMDMRYELLAEVGVRDIAGFNAAIDNGDLPTADAPDRVTGKGYERLPFIVVVVDELNDLMMVAARDVEASICRIAQMARAVGIHLVIATQRPSVDVITGVIKANVPSRLAFSVTSIADSRVVLDHAGAEKLIGLGDMLVVTASESKPTRVQGAWVDEACVRQVVAHWKRQAGGPMYVEGIAEETVGASGSSKGGRGADDDDVLLVEAMELVVRSGLGSTSMLQRKLRVGFARAGRLMDLLERRGVVGPSEGSKARNVLMTTEEFDAMERRGAE